MGSYVTTYDADIYFVTRFDSGEWDKQTAETKLAALTTATKYIDTLNFAGDKNIESQALEFPRGDDTVVPQQIKDACCEIAYALITGRDVEYEAELMNAQSLSLGESRVSNISGFDIAKLHGIPSRLAWDLLTPFLRDAHSLKISRVD